MKSSICTGAAIAGGCLTALFGGWDGALTTLMIVMGIDYLTGLLAAGLFQASSKSAGGGLESRAGWKGLCRKGAVLLVVLVACRLDLLVGGSLIRDGVVIGFVTNEVLSILENAGLMGVPIPAAVVRSLEILKKRADGKEDAS